MPNPYHDAEGKFCSKNEMKAAYEQLGSQGKLEDYFKLRTEYDKLTKENSPFEMATTPRNTKNKTPIVVTPYTLNQPYSVDLNYLIEYDYDDYTHDFGSNYSTYVNPHVDESKTINPRAVLKKVFGVEDLPEELNEAADSFGLDNHDNYHLETHGDYYGEDISIKLNDSTFAAIKQWYSDRDNAIDEDNIYGYVRAKGTSTYGHSTVDALKAQLSEEFGSKNLPTAVQTAKHVSVQNLTTEEVQVLDISRLKNTTPNKSANPTGENDADKIAGVVVVKNDAYVLIDGYARHKGLSDKTIENKYFVLEQRPPFSWR